MSIENTNLETSQNKELSASETKKQPDKKSHQVNEIIRRAREGPHEPLSEAQKIINEARTHPKKPLSQAQRIINEARGESASSPTPEEKVEQPKKQEGKSIPAERIKELREFIKAAKDAGIDPKEFIKEKVRKTGTGKGYQDIPEAFKIFEKILFLGAPEKISLSMKYYYSYNFEMGRKLIDAGCIKPRHKDEDPAATFIRAQQEPESIIDPQKYREVLQKSEEEFFAANPEPVDLKKVTQELRKIRKEQEKEAKKSKRS